MWTGFGNTFTFGLKDFEFSIGMVLHESVSWWVNDPNTGSPGETFAPVLVSPRIRLYVTRTSTADDQLASLQFRGMGQSRGALRDRDLGEPRCTTRNQHRPRRNRCRSDNSNRVYIRCTFAIKQYGSYEILEVGGSAVSGTIICLGHYSYGDESEFVAWDELLSHFAADSLALASDNSVANGPLFLDFTLFCVANDQAR